MRNLSKKKMLIIIIVLLVIEIILCILYLRNSNNNSRTNFSLENVDISGFTSDIVGSELETAEESTETASSTITTTAEVTSALTENIELHTTYYLEECYVEADDEVSAGDYLVKYTNETYLTAPYDCVINNLNVPDEGEECNNNYIQISSTSLLAVSISVDESIVENLSLGQEAEITISAYEDKVLTGYITSISNTANNGSFTVVIEFDNDGDIKLGMTAEVEI